MTCQQIETLLIPHLDGKLSLRHKHEVEQHLEACSSCAARVRDFAEVSGLLDEWKGIEPSAFFNARLEQRIAAEAAATGWWGGWFQRLVLAPLGNPALAVALLAIVSFGIVFLRYSPAPPQTLATPEPPVVAAAISGEDELALYRNLAVLEDWEVLRNFEVLQELSSTHP